MLKPDKEAGEGVTVRDSYRVAAENPRHHSNAVAVRMLTGPPLPESLEYLWVWLLDIRRGLGSGMEGLHPLTWVVLDAWTRLTGTTLDPEEASALLTIDAVMRDPGSIGAAAWT